MMILRPKDDILEANGKVTYHETSRAWCRIRLTQNIIDKFPQLKEQERRILFNLKFYNSYQLLSEAIKGLEENKEGLPMLLFLVQK